MSKLKFLSFAILGLGIPASALAQNYSADQIASAMLNLNAAILRNSSYSQHNNLWSRMRQDFRMSEVNPEIVRRHENYFSTRSAYFNRTVERSRPYLYHILSEVEKRNMPSEIALLPFIESAFVTRARSPVGASGLWQFMPATGRHYGLAQNNIYDGRHDIYASTNAALNYLQYLHNMFGDWSLALAAYNWGEGNVSRAINRARNQGLEPVYENLNMPNETRNYVPKLLAVRNLVSNPQVFGLSLSNIENKPYFQAINIDDPIDINAITRLANISQAEFEALNPSFKVPVFLPENGQRKLLLPVGAVNAFERNLRSAPKESLLSYDILRSDGATTLSDIADRSGLSVTELRRANGLTSNTIRAGLPILVAKNSLNGGQFSRSVQMLADTQQPGDDPLGKLIRQNIADGQPSARRTALARTTAASAPNPRTDQPMATTPSRDQLSVQSAGNKPLPGDNTVSRQTESLASAQTNRLPAPDVQATPTPTAQTANEQPSPAAVASNQAITAPFTEAASHSDPLMALASGKYTVAPEHNPTDADIAANAAASVRASLAQTQLEENRQVQAEQHRPTASDSRRLATNSTAEQRRTRPTQQQTGRRAPQTVTHKVQPGESLYAIARRYHVDVADLTRNNNLRGNNIRPGQVLRVSGTASNQSASARQAANQPDTNGNRRTDNSRNNRHSRRQQAISHTVRSGDTLQSIARRYNTSVADLRRGNNLNGTLLRPGQKLRVPSGT